MTKIKNQVLEEKQQSDRTTQENRKMLSDE
jgi:hypothetical protein